MKFEAITPEVPKAGDDGVALARFTLEQGAFAGQRFAAALRVCLNPCCPCEAVSFTCRPAGEPCGSQPGTGVAPVPLRFDLDVFERAANTRVESVPEGVALAGAVVAEMQPADWERLAQLFLTVKRRQMERMDLDALHVSFPREVMEGNGSMVGYAEVFPWSDPFAFTRADTRWVADDQYCVQPGCKCTQTALAFCRMTAPAVPPGRPAECDVFLRHDYTRGKTEVLEASPGGPAADELMQALRAAHSDLERTFQERHRQMKRLGERLLSKTRRRSKRAFSYRVDEGVGESPAVPPTPPAKPAPKAGRNDPCPCGSGKKYKRCCGG